MPIDNCDIALFTVTHTYEVINKVEEMIHKMMGEAKERMEKEQLKTDNCYPELTHIEEENKLYLTIYRRVSNCKGAN